MGFVVPASDGLPSLIFAGLSSGSLTGVWPLCRDGERERRVWTVE